MTVRRVVVAICTGDGTGRVVREAVRVASRLDAELEGRFLEDEDLLKLAAHPFARRVGSAGETRGFSIDDVERVWRALAGVVRAALEREAAREQVPAHFEVQRGRLRDAVARHLEESDLVVLGWGGWSPSANRAAPIRVLFDGSEASERALEAGARLAGEDGRLSIWAERADDATLGALRERLRGRVARLRVAPIEDPSVEAIGHILADRPGGLLLVPAGSAIAATLAAGDREARFPAGVLVVR